MAARTVGLYALLLALILPALSRASGAGAPRGVRVPILVYHKFGSRAPDEFTVRTATLAWQLHYLGTHGYHVIRLRDYIEYRRGSGPSPPPRSVILTADDGRRCVFTDMLPLVRAYRDPVTLFIYPSSISNASYAMSWTQLADLVHTGLFDVESHAYWHPNFRIERQQLAPAQYSAFVRTQLSLSKRVLERRLGIHVEVLAWPFGVYDAELMRAASAAGYVAAVTLERRTAGPTDSLLALPRYIVTDADVGAAFARILRTASGAALRAGGDGRERAALAQSARRPMAEEPHRPSLAATAVSDHTPRLAGSPDPSVLVSSGVRNPPADPIEVFQGRVLDAATHRPLADAIVTLGSRTVRTGSGGEFSIDGSGDRIGVRAYGHGRLWVSRAALERSGGEVALPAFVPKALYLSSYGIASAQLRANALELARTTEINALVVDVKGDRGIVAYPSRVPLAIAIGAERPRLIPDLKGLVASLHARGLYAIARIVVFKDNVLAEARPDLAVRSADGALWRDREHLAWTDPFSRTVWDYNIGLAVEAAQAGFDEIQFDYVRFPDAAGVLLSRQSTQQSRVEAISGFLALARRRLAPYNVFISADVFGYICWNLDDTNIGQTLAAILPQVDYLSPMLYPSTFRFGIPGFRDPVAYPYDIVYLSLQRALRRTGVPADRFRPWLQAFRDYAFDRRAFGSVQIRAQIDAANATGTDGWMLWNPRNVYTSAGLEPRLSTDRQVAKPHVSGATPAK